MARPRPSRLRRSCLLVALAALTGTSSAGAADAGRFVGLDAKLGAARAGTAMVGLPDGRAFLAGGFTGATTELFDPLSGTFSPGPALPEARQGAGAALLADGRVLIAGGSQLASTIFTPQSGTFAPGPSLSTVRVRPVVAPLPGGKVLVAGGTDAGSAVIASAEVYDPGTGLFAPTGAMGLSRAGAVAAKLPDGRVLVAGGRATSNGNSTTASAEIYDPGTGTFSATAGPLTGPRFRAAGAPLPDGRVLIAGGQFDGTATSLASAEVFLPGTGTFEALTGVGGQLTTARYGASAATLADGRILIASGFDGVTHLDSAELLVGAPAADVVADGAFGEGRVGLAGAARTFTVTNPTANPLEISSVRIDGDAPDDFELVADTCAEARLSGGQSCAMSVRFAPTDLGPRGATLTIVDNAPSAVQTVPLSGVGVLTLAPSPLPSPTPAPTPAPTPTPSATPAPAAKPSFTCAVKAKSRRRQLTCTARAPGRRITGFTVRATRKGKTVASRTVLGSRLTLTARRPLAKATYTLRATVVVAGRKVALTRTLRVR